MNSNADNTLPPLFWDSILDRIDPHRPQSGVTMAAQIMCARWLILGRLQKGILRSTLAAWVGIADETLLLIEAGVAKPNLLDLAERKRLCAHLASESHTMAWVSAVCALALAEPVANAEQYIADVIRDLDSLPVSESILVETLVADQPELQPHGVAAPIDPVEQPLLDILMQLAVKQSDEHQLWQACQQRQKTEMRMVAHALQRLQAAYLITRADAGQQSEQRVFYCLTPYGGEVLEAEQRRQARLAQNPPNPQQPQLKPSKDHL